MWGCWCRVGVLVKVWGCYRVGVLVKVWGCYRVGVLV